VKGVDGLVETVAGAFVGIAGTQGLYAFIIRITAPELDYHPGSHVIQLIRRGASGLAHSSHRFVVVWLLVHGILKLVLAVELLRGKSWIFPFACAILAGFVAYMTYRLAHHWSSWMFAFALFDVMTLALVANEWRAHRAR